MSFFGMLFNINKYNGDPFQQEISQGLIDMVEGKSTAQELRSWMSMQGWPPSEARNRLTHALSMVKVFRADLYPEAKRQGMQIYMSF